MGSILAAMAATAGGTATAAQIATTATTVAVVGAGVATAGVVAQSRQASAAAESAENMAAFNAAIEKREAEAIRQKAGFEQRRQAKRGERIKGALTAKIAAAGGLGSPVAADLAAEQAAELELENLLIGFGGEVGARRAESQARLDELQAGILKKKGKAARMAGGIQAGATLLTGFGSMGGASTTPRVGAPSPSIYRGPTFA